MLPPLVPLSSQSRLTRPLVGGDPDVVIVFAGGSKAIPEPEAGEQQCAEKSAVMGHRVRRLCQGIIDPAVRRSGWCWGLLLRLVPRLRLIPRKSAAGRVTALEIGKQLLGTSQTACHSSPD